MKTIIPAIIAAGFVMQYLLVFAPGQDKPLRLFILKALASLCFAFAGTAAYITVGGSVTELLITLGLIFGMLGDIFLHLRFVVFEKPCQHLGIFSFLCGHGLSIASMFTAGAQWYIGLIFMAILLPAVRKYIFYHDMDFGKMVPLGTIYMAVELLFSGLALSRMIVSTTFAPAVFFVGSVLFVFSDTMWILQNFAVNKKPIYRVLCLVPYYLAQNLFVVSILL